MFNLKVRVQVFGRFLSNMVMPNIGAFIAWGFITALFIPSGWWPHASFAKLVGPMVTYLLPLLIGYTGGRLVGGERGAVVGAITTMGIIVGSEIPMFLGAMIVGPMGGYVIKKFDQFIDGKIKSGFEMLVNNFSAGIIGMLLALFSFSVIGGIVTHFSEMLATGVKALVDAKLLVLTSIIVEPAKILFLNNAINHGIFTPLGIQESAESGKSIFFLIEANPGPGLGVLLSYMFFGRGSAKETAGSASIIHFFGGIHEIYFPYVLMNPRLIIAVIAGGATGVLTNTLLGGGLIAPASPGSIIAVLTMTPAGAYFAVISSVVLSCTVTFIISSLLLKVQNKEGDDNALAAAQAEMAEMKLKSKDIGLNSVRNLDCVSKVYVACDAGMGSSAMGAGLLRKKIQAVNLNIEVENIAINNLPTDAKLIVTHKDLTDRAKKQVPEAKHLSINNFLDAEFYNRLVEKLSGGAVKENVSLSSQKQILTTGTEKVLSITTDQIFLNLKANTKEEAIEFAGRQLVKLGFVEEEYVSAMFKREQQVSTYLGEGIAVPHGTIEAKDKVLKTGIVFCQYRDGVRFTDEEDGVARLIIGIAARNNEHIQVVSAMTNALDDKKAMAILTMTDDPQQVLRLLNGE